LLDHSQTIELIIRAQTGDEVAKDTLLSHNSPLIKSIIRRWRNKGVEYDDLYQLGCMGFLKAIKNFDPEFGVRFSTYAVPMIAGEVKRFLRDDGCIKVSRALKVMSNKINRFIEEYKKENCSDPSLDEIAKRFGIDAQEVVFTMDSSRRPISIYEKSEDGGDKSQSLIEKLSYSDKNEDILDKIILKEMIDKLPEREKKIIVLRFFRDKTQSEIAEILGVSQVQISRLEAKILEKLKEKLA